MARFRAKRGVNCRGFTTLLKGTGNGIQLPQTQGTVHVQRQQPGSPCQQQRRVPAAGDSNTRLALVVGLMVLSVFIRWLEYIYK